MAVTISADIETPIQLVTVIKPLKIQFTYVLPGPVIAGHVGN